MYVLNRLRVGYREVVDHDAVPNGASMRPNTAALHYIVRRAMRDPVYVYVVKGGMAILIDILKFGVCHRTRNADGVNAQVSSSRQT